MGFQWVFPLATYTTLLLCINTGWMCNWTQILSELVIVFRCCNGRIV